jgi:2-oxoglutarate dehydrogenase E2 component (dihydrolipoamide succinyltransferase)
MSVEVKIPTVGESVSSGLLSQWLKNDGDYVNAGDPLLTLETDKVSNEVAAESAGILRCKVPAGSEVAIGQTVAVIEPGNAPATAPVTAPPISAPTPTPPPVPVASRVDPAPTPAAPTPVPANVARPSAIDLREAVSHANDVLSRISENATLPTQSTDGRITRKKMTPLRRKIASALVQAQHTAAILTTFNEADMSAVMKLRGALQEAFTKEHGIKLGFMSFFIKAVVGALRAVPQINVRVDGDEIVQHHFHDIGVAVGTEKGLMVPVIRNADQKSFADLERDLAAFAVKARDGKITTEDLSGGVFTISNGGIYGSLLSTPILNAPQSGILGMHKIQQRPVAVEKPDHSMAVEIRPMMYLALSYDHRVVDGKEAVTFLVRVKDAIENPARLLLDL